LSNLKAEGKKGKMIHSIDPNLLAASSAIILPFLAFFIIMVLTRSHPGTSAGLSIGAVTVSLISSLFLLINNRTVDHPLQYAGRWLVSGDVTISFGFLIDPVSLLMLTLVAAVSLLVQVYSLGYMSEDPGFSRYFGFQSLFAGSMMSLTLSSSLLQLYFFWELVGLCSYLLIGFWYAKFSATEAGKKAFVMTRLGDVAFFIGLLLVLLNLGNLNILEINSPAAGAGMTPGLFTLASLLIFGGIVGKSAQFPLLTWLPDAMEGPTPVSALLHSATMVAAGVYLFARLFPFFSQSPSAMTVFLAIGTITMVMSSTMALVDRDIKKVWAYSTISQLGYMIMALGAGGYFAGIFHLTAHAGFKALLFLCSGVWIHYYKTNDMFEIGRRSGRSLKIPLICLILAGASLSGIPPLAGFFSKEAILETLAHLNNPLWLIAGLIGVFLTPYYTFRAIFIVLFPKTIEPKGPSKERPTGQAYWAMVWPLVILAATILVLGFFEGSLRNFLTGRSGSGNEGHWLTYLSLAIVLSTVALTWVEFGRPKASQIGFAERISSIRNFLAERWYLDHIYRILLDRVIYRTFAYPFTRNDQRVIDGSLDGICRFTVSGGRLVSLLQSGKVRYNFFVLFIILGVVSFYFFFS
jgi:NADH-quinone oxidoreductase subunit L